MAVSKRPVPLPRNPLRGVMSDEDIAALRRRNEWRAKTARENLGTLYCLHPANRATRRFVGSRLPFPSTRLGGF